VVGICLGEGTVRKEESRDIQISTKYRNGENVVWVEVAGNGKRNGIVEFSGLCQTYLLVRPCATRALAF
jgi:hypothetical protein